MTALVTRPREDAGALCAALAARGVGVMLEPMLKVVFEQAASPDFSGLQGYLATSANGVRALACYPAPRDLPLWAVGDATAGVARDLGFSRVESADGTVGDLAAMVRGRCRATAGAFLHAAARDLAGDLSALLGGDGFSVRREILYRTEPPDALTGMLAEALRDGAIRWAFFFSPRSGESFVTLVRKAKLESSLRGVVALALSEKAAASLGGLDWQRVCHPARPNRDAMLDLFDDIRGKQ